MQWPIPLQIEPRVSCWRLVYTDIGVGYVSVCDFPALALHFRVHTENPGPKLLAERGTGVHRVKCTD